MLRGANYVHSFPLKAPLHRGNIRFSTKVDKRPNDELAPMQSLFQRKAVCTRKALERRHRVHDASR